jgi:hypothetical protein
VVIRFFPLLREPERTWVVTGRFPNVAFSTQNFSEVARQHGIQKEASHRLSRCRSWQSYKSALQRLALSMRQGRSSLIKKDEGNRLNTPLTYVIHIHWTKKLA